MMSSLILIVENNPSHLKLEKITLEREGYVIRTAKDADETMKVLETFKPQLILMGVDLPGINGLELTRQLKDDPKYKNIIIVAVTAHGFKGDKEKILAAGYDGYIAKPIDVESFPQIVASYLTGTISSEKR